jgi:hypothetical protein
MLAARQCDLGHATVAVDPQIDGFRNRERFGKEAGALRGEEGEPASNEGGTGGIRDSS